jgi:hypothetical protein
MYTRHEQLPVESGSGVDLPTVSGLALVYSSLIFQDTICLGHV